MSPNHGLFLFSQVIYEISLRETRLIFFNIWNCRSGETTDGLYPILTIKQIMWALKNKSQLKEMDEKLALTDVIFSENYIVVYEEVIFMTYKQIEAAREVRLWIGQIIVPAATVAVTAMTIPEVRQAIAAKANSIKRNIESKMHKREA